MSITEYGSLVSEGALLLVLCSGVTDDAFFRLCPCKSNRRDRGEQYFHPPLPSPLPGVPVQVFPTAELKATVAEGVAAGFADRKKRTQNPEATIISKVAAFVLPSLVNLPAENRDKNMDENKHVSFKAATIMFRAESSQGSDTFKGVCGGARCQSYLVLLFFSRQRREGGKGRACKLCCARSIFSIEHNERDRWLPAVDPILSVLFFGLTMDIRILLLHWNPVTKRKSYPLPSDALRVVYHFKPSLSSAFAS